MSGVTGVQGSWVKRTVKEHDTDPSVLGKDCNLKRVCKVGQQKREELLQQVTYDAQVISISNEVL